MVFKKYKVKLSNVFLVSIEIIIIIIFKLKKYTLRVKSEIAIIFIVINLK